MNIPMRKIGASTIRAGRRKIMIDAKTARNNTNYAIDQNLRDIDSQIQIAASKRLFSIMVDLTVRDISPAEKSRLENLGYNIFYSPESSSYKISW